MMEQKELMHFRSLPKLSLMNRLGCTHIEKEINIMKCFSWVFLGVIGSLLLFFPAISSASESALGTVSQEPPSDMQFVCIPAGSFSMGSSSSESGHESNEGPVHTVTIQSFEMMTTEVTQGMWQEVMGNNPSYFTGDLNRPVEKVSWDDCQEFVDAMNDLDPDHEYRLPTESEWEYACRAGTTTRFYWGNDPGHTLVDEYEWYQENSGNTTHPVGQKFPNAWGLYDMGGNVLEWCQDYWHEDYSSYSGAPRDGSPWVYPSDSYRVGRGGNLMYRARYCRSATRTIGSPDSRRSDLGFRLARSIR